MVSGGRSDGSVFAGERKGSGSHSGEWRGSGVLSGAREKATAVSCTSTAPGQRKNTGTVAKQKQLPSSSRPTRTQPPHPLAREGASGKHFLVLGGNYAIRYGNDVIFITFHTRQQRLKGKK